MSNVTIVLTVLNYTRQHQMIVGLFGGRESKFMRTSIDGSLNDNKFHMKMKIFENIRSKT